MEKRCKQTHSCRLRRQDSTQIIDSSTQPKITAAAWKQKFFPKLKRQHGTHAKKVFHRLMNKSSSLRSTLKRRSRDYEVHFELSLVDVRKMIYSAYGQTCRYCTNRLDVTNMVCDHIQPISSGGPSTKQNLQLICKRCNTRKGPLSHTEYNNLIKWLEHQNEDAANYILRKLAAKDVFNG